jgi:hypothetical protein
VKAAEAILGGALAASLLSTLALLVLNLIGNNAVTLELFAAFGAWFGITFLLATGFASTLGLAWHMLATGRGWRNLHYYWLPGALTGFVPTMLVFSPTPTAALYFGSYSALLGGLTGLFAWLIRRPDRSG